MRVTPRDACSARFAFWDGVTEQIRYVISVDVGRPEPRGEGAPEFVKVEITDPGLFDRPSETDHQLTTFPSCALGVKDKLVIARVLPQVSENFQCPSG